MLMKIIIYFVVSVTFEGKIKITILNVFDIYRLPNDLKLKVISAI